MGTVGVYSPTSWCQNGRILPTDLRTLEPHSRCGTITLKQSACPKGSCPMERHVHLVIDRW